MKPVTVLFFLVLVLGVSALADDAINRAKLSGAWQLGDEKGPRWILDQRLDDVHLTYLEGDRKVTEFECNTIGRECQTKVSGKSAKVSMWFSGSKLVELDTKGQEIVKRRFAVADQGDVLELEVIPILPGGKSEAFHFRRVQR